MMKENPKTAIFIAYVTYALGQLCFVTYNILIFRQFSLEEVGAYGLIISIVTFIAFALDLGISQTLVRGFSQHTLSLSQAVTAAMVLRIPLLGVGLAAFGIWLSLSSGQVAKESFLLLPAVFSQFLIGLRTIATSWLRAHDRQNIGNVLNTLQPVGYFSVAGLLLVCHAFRLFPLFFGILLVEIIITGLSFAVIKNLATPSGINKSMGFTEVRAALAAIWKPSLIFFVVSFWATIQSRLDWIMVYAYGSKTELAYYSLANKVYELFESGISVMINTIFPWMCRMLLSGEQKPRMVIGFKGIIFLGTLLAAATALYLPGFLSIFWGNKFDQANTLIFWLMCGACLNNLCTMMYYLLIADGKERYFLIIVTIPAILQIISNIVLIPRYGNYGAVISMLILINASFLLISIACIKNRLVNYISLYKNTMIITIIIIIMFFIKTELQSSYLFSALFFLVALCFGSLILFSKQERSLILVDLRGFLRLISPKTGKNT
jgi:O-antigen/teichoic acid export membrane protein